MHRDMNQIKNDILRDYKLVKKISFSDDIDRDKSGKYLVDKNNGYLEFQYDEKSIVTHDDYSAVIGSVEHCNGQIIIKPTLFSTKNYHSDMKQAQILIDKSIDRNSCNLVKIEFESISFSDRLYFRLNNDNHYKRLKAVICGEAEYTRQIFENSGSRSLACIYDKGVFSLAYYEEVSHNVITYKEIDCANTISLLADMDKKCFIVNGKKLYYTNYPVSKDIESFLSISLLTESNGEGQGRLAINRIAYGNRAGYVYFKPIRLERKTVRVFVIYNGMPQVQYQDKEVSWVDIDDQTGSFSVEELRIRIKMNVSDRIYDMIVVEAVE